MPLPIKIIIFFLAALLFSGGIAFIFYSETTQYRVSLNNAATTVARSTRYAYLKTQSTANVINTAQANIFASATAQANATVTAGAFTDLYTQSIHGNPVFDDPLTDNTGPGRWDQGNPNPNTGCAFVHGYYLVAEAGQGKFQPCIAQATSFSNFAYRVRLTITKGNQGQAGLIFRTDNDNASYYFFYIDTNGSYALDLYEKSDRVSNLLQGMSSAISIGLGRSNQVAVIANSDAIYLYANEHYLASVMDSTLSAGKIGLGVVNRNTPVEVQFDKAQVWQLVSGDTQATPMAGASYNNSFPVSRCISNIVV
jgi:hypothetical protein